MHMGQHDPLELFCAYQHLVLVEPWEGNGDVRGLGIL